MFYLMKSTYAIKVVKIKHSAFLGTPSIVYTGNELQDLSILLLSSLPGWQLFATLPRIPVQEVSVAMEENGKCGGKEDDSGAGRK